MAAMTTITLFGHRVTVLEAIVPKLRRIEARWRGRGGHDFYRVDAVYGFANRNIAGTNRKSQHSHGWALDINPSRNPVHRSRVVTDMPQEFINWWKMEGFGWGGDWRSKKDPMHFSMARNEGGTGDVLAMGSDEFGEDIHDHDFTGEPDRAGISPDEVRRMYQSAFGRHPTSSELARWTNADPGEAFSQLARQEEARIFSGARLGLNRTERAREEATSRAQFSQGFE